LTTLGFTKSWRSPGGKAHAHSPSSSSVRGRASFSSSTGIPSCTG
jgi:hypothetical protein